MIRHDPGLLEYFRKKPFCEWCGQASGRHNAGGMIGVGCLDPHHIRRRGLGGGSRLDVALNLMGVHRTCHQEIEAGGAAANRRCLEIVARREGLSGPDEVQEAIWRLLRQPKE